MKIYLYISLFAVLMLAGCDRPGDDVIADIETCELYQNMSYPGVWQFRMYEFSGKDIPSHTHFVNEYLGFVAGNSTDYNQAYANVTVDGGLSWQGYQMSFHEPATSFWFQDENHAFVGIEQQVGGNTRFARTGDGGTTWVIQEYEELNGNIVDLYFENEERGYAILNSNDSLDRISLLATNDAGQSWEEIFYDATLLHSSGCPLSMTITDNRIYRVGAGGNIYILDRDGEMIAIIQGPETEILQIQVVSDMVFYVVTSSGLYSSHFGGIDWEKKQDGDVRIGAFFDGDAGLVIHNHNYCEAEVYHAHDALSATMDQGLTWNEGGITSNLLVGLAHGERVTNDLAVCLIGNRLVFCNR